MSWGSIVLLLLQIAKAVFDYANNKKLIDAGADQEIAKSSAAILAKTEFAKKTRELVHDLPGSDLDVLLDDLAKPDGK